MSSLYLHCRRGFEVIATAVWVTWRETSCCFSKTLRPSTWRDHWWDTLFTDLLSSSLLCTALLKKCVYTAHLFKSDFSHCRNYFFFLLSYLSHYLSYIHKTCRLIGETLRPLYIFMPPHQWQLWPGKNMHLVADWSSRRPYHSWRTTCLSV